MWRCARGENGEVVSLPRLRTLHAQMRAAGETRCRFTWPTRRHGREFSVVFLTDLRPMVLLFGLCGGQLAFEFDVDADYSFRPFLGEKYSALLDALGLRPDREDPFRPSAFFQDFADVIPVALASTRPVTPRDVPRTRQIEDAEKIYFIGWRYHGAGSHVSFANLEKTRVLLGEEFHHRCRDGNISSCWSDDPHADHPAQPPQRP
ncbi:hypothetical protein ASF48_17695 [Rathayibacter sp. Leaf299]|uniref:DUF6037 family protein n=1 Tax=Rathayibacter sp. Leaf299 TaxID=1736328 RepID=UPI0007139A30|nr:hypothetical protein ASF48_17695 [Rathayibacter sp. Leaf299]